MEGKSVVAEMKYEEGKDSLTEAQIQAIAEEAIKEAKEPVKEKDPWENPADDKSKEDDKAAKESDAKAIADKEAADKAALEAAKKAEEDKPKEVKDDVKDKKDDVKAGEAKKDEENKFQVPAETRAKLVEELALKESLTLDEAEAQIAKDEAIVNKYKNNPVEMARAIRHIQRESDKAKTELEATRKAGNTPPAPVINNVKDYVAHQLEPIKDKVIEAYRKEYPELSEGQEDSYIYGLVKKDAIDRTLKVMEENQSKLISAAKEKRANLIMGLSDTDRAFLPDVKAILDRTSDRQIMDKSYDIKDIVHWAKGRQVERLVKEAEERGYKRGQEQSKIIGEKTPGAGNKQPSGAGGAKKPTLSELQKERALNMFDIPGMTEEEKFDAFIEVHPEQFKR